MSIRTINSETNSYFTKDEMNQLKERGFSWNNHSNNCNYGFDNFLSKHQFYYTLLEAKTKNLRINGRKETEQEVEYKITKSIPTLFGKKRIHKTFENFNLMIKETKKVYIGNILLILNAFIFLLFYTLFRLCLILIPTFIENKKDLKEYFSHLKGLWKFNYFILNDVLPFVWSMNLLILGIVIGYLLKIS